MKAVLRYRAIAAECARTPPGRACEPMNRRPFDRRLHQRRAAPRPGQSRATSMRTRRSRDRLTSTWRSRRPARPRRRPSRRVSANSAVRSSTSTGGSGRDCVALLSHRGEKRHRPRIVPRRRCSPRMGHRPHPHSDLYQMRWCGTYLPRLVARQRHCRR